MNLALHYEDGEKILMIFLMFVSVLMMVIHFNMPFTSLSFLGERFYVDERVLIPRSETEELVIYMSKLISDENIANPIIADVCTGSGDWSQFKNGY